MYLLKTKGTNKIPDYIQLRDDNFALIAHFRIANLKRTLEKLNIASQGKRIELLIEETPFGVLKKIEE